MAIGVTVQFIIKEGEGAGFQAAFAAASQRVKAEDAGCEMYDLFENVTDPTRYAMVERWTSSDELKAHSKSPAMKEMAKIAPFLGGAPIITQYDLE
jgi:quinol monooxygenase YgiN